MAENCPTCHQPMPEPIVVEYVNGTYVDTYWTDTGYHGKTAMQAALARIEGLKSRWGIDAQIRPADA